MTISTIFIIGLVAFTIGLICACINFVVWSRAIFSDPSKINFGKVICLHIICALLYVSGMIVMIISGIIWITGG